jgi:hypothetical protein
MSAFREFFGHRSKPPPELVKALKDSLSAIEKIDKGDKKAEKCQEDIAKYLIG